MNKKKALQPLSENTRKLLIIGAIVLVAVIVLSVSLALILSPSDKKLDDESSSSGGSSSLTIRNGDFAYTSSNDTAYPRTAQNWTRYGYKTKSGSETHDFESISTHEQAVMGIIDLDDWDAVKSDLAEEGLTVETPGTDGRENVEDLKDSNVYMIATKKATTASILSDSFSVSSGASVKITLLLNTHQLAKNSNAVVMIQKSTVSALEKYWYAYDCEIAPTEENEWVEYTFYIFNRESSTQYIRINIGIGNVYSGEGKYELVDGKPITGEGVLFIDDIMYETVTANDYRKQVDAEGAEESTLFKVIENVDIVDDSVYLPLEGEVGTSVEVLNYNKYLEATLQETKEEATDDNDGYSPFTVKDDFDKSDNDPDEVKDAFYIYRVSTSTGETIGLRLENDVLNNIESSLIFKDHHHISFWVRVYQENGNKAAKANIHIQSKESNSSAKWEDLKDGSWKSFATNQDIDTDSNAGWVKYDVYIKPSAVMTDISILFTFGDEKATDLTPEGYLYVTKPAYETISYKDYNNASGNNVKKFDLVGSSANASVSNGSFSSLNNTGLQPTSWTPVFAGDNAIYLDGKGNTVDLDRSANAVLGSGVVNDDGSTPHKDDKQNKVLKIVNKVDTSFGYLSSNITLSARTAYVISVVANGNPYIYLLNNDTSLDREDRVISAVTSKTAQSVEDDRFLGETTNTLGGEWARYYFIIVTGNASQSVRLALFNGSLDGKTKVSGEVMYDQVEIHTLDSYSLVDNNKDVDKDSDEQLYYDVEWNGHGFTDNVKDYGKNFGELLEKLQEKLEEGEELTLWGISIVQPTEDEWEEMKLIPKTEKDDTTDDTTTTDTSSELDLGLLFSVISSVALVAALAVVAVVKLFRNRKSTPKAA